MRILVAYASRYGSTKGIAERIARTLADSGEKAIAMPFKEARDPAGYDAYVIGSAAYMFRWMPDAADFVRRHAALLKTKPVWLFSSGPLGTDKVDAEGRDVLEASVPKDIAELAPLIGARGHMVFFGAFDHTRLKGAHRLVYAMPAMKKVMLDGDYRDWSAIDSWARSIASALEPAAVT